MIMALGFTSLGCGGLAAVLSIPLYWVPLLRVFIRILAVGGIVTGYLSFQMLRERLPYMQQQMAAYGQPFRKPFDWGLLGLVVSAAALLCI